MQTTETLKRQIDTTGDLAVVVRTMKTLAAVNIRQYEAAADSLKDYERILCAATEMVIWNDFALQDVRSEAASKNTGLIVFGSDQGMCGGFNDAIATHVTGILSRDCVRHSSAPMIVLGRRLVARLLDAGREIDGSVELPGAASGITSMLQELLPRIDQWQADHALDSVIVCHNRRLSQTQYEPTERQLLPISPRQLVGERPKRWPGKSLPMLTLPPHELWQSIARQFLFVSSFLACAESQASENAARIAAMQAAETHIRESLDDFNREYQQLRQTSITEELLDIITGFEALSHSL